MKSERMIIDSASAWTGAQLASSPAWQRELSAGDIEIIEAGLERFRRTGLPWQEAGKATFDLSGLESFLSDLREELENGVGLVRVRGLPVDRYGRDDLRAIFLAFGHHLGMPVSQSVKGERLLGLTDEGGKAADRGALNGDSGQFLASRARAYSTGELRFHTDRCDVVGLLCVNQARAGGESRITSAVTIHNAMLERRPDLLDELFEDYPRSRFGEEVEDASAHYMLPVFTERDGKFATHYSRTYIEASQTNPDVPRLRETQNEALDLLAELGSEHCLDMRLEPGDMQFLNNHVIYHARTPYEDHDDPERKRLLLRLWLAMPNSRPLRDSFAVLFGDTEPGAIRGGIWPPGEPPSV